jgi:hypothetical protein
LKRHVLRLFVFLQGTPRGAPPTFSPSQTDPQSVKDFSHLLLLSIHASDCGAKHAHMGPCDGIRTVGVPGWNLFNPALTVTEGGDLAFVTQAAGPGVAGVASVFGIIDPSTGVLLPPLPFPPLPPLPHQQKLRKEKNTSKKQNKKAQTNKQKTKKHKTAKK